MSIFSVSELLDLHVFWAPSCNIIFGTKFHLFFGTFFFCFLAQNFFFGTNPIITVLPCLLNWFLVLLRRCPQRLRMVERGLCPLSALARWVSHLEAADSRQATLGPASACLTWRGATGSPARRSWSGRASGWGSPCPAWGPCSPGPPGQKWGIQLCGFSPVSPGLRTDQTPCPPPGQARRRPSAWSSGAWQRGPGCRRRMRGVWTSRKWLR